MVEGEVASMNITPTNVYMDLSVEIKWMRIRVGGFM